MVQAGWAQLGPWSAPCCGPAGEGGALGAAEESSGGEPAAGPVLAAASAFRAQGDAGPA